MCDALADAYAFAHALADGQAQGGELPNTDTSRGPGEFAKLVGKVCVLVAYVCNEPQHHVSMLCAAGNCGPSGKLRSMCFFDMKMMGASRTGSSAHGSRQSRQKGDEGYCPE